MAKLKLDLLVDDKGSVVVKAFGKHAQTAMNVAKTGAVAAGAGVAALVGGLYVANRVMSEAVALANTQEKAEAKLGAVLQATGNAAGYNLDQMKKMASSMQAVTTVGDEVILGGQAILASFKQIRGEAFERATMAALDMADVMGTDLNSAMVQIGKAVNDPIKGLSALSRVGVTFTDEQKRMIAALQESGRVAEAQAIILAELESEFGGAAAAARETFGGAVTAAGNALGDMKEELGFTITRSKFFTDLVKMAEAQFIAWGNAIADNRVDLQNLAKAGILYVVDKMGVAIETLRFFHNGWLGLKMVGQTAINVLATSIDVLIKGLRILLFPLDELMKALVALGAIDSNPFDALTRSTEQFKYATRDVTAEIVADIEKTNAGYDAVKKKLKAWRDGVAAIPVVAAKAEKAQVKQYAAITDAVVQTSKEKAKAAKAELKLASEIAKAYGKMYGDLKGKAQGYFDFKIAALRKERDNYKALTRDQATVDRWYESQLEDLLDERALAHGNFFDGVGAGYRRMLRDQYTWAQGGLAVFDTFTSSAKSMFSDGLFRAMKGDLSDFSDLWQGFLDSMLRSFVDMIAQMAVQWGTQSVMGMVGLPVPGGGGGLVSSALQGYGISSLFGGGGGYGATALGGVSMAGEANVAGLAAAEAGIGSGFSFASALPFLAPISLPLLLGPGGLGQAASNVFSGVGNVIHDVVGGIGDFIGGIFHQGGIVPRAHGGMFLGADERLVVAQTGEGILSRSATQAIGGKPAIDAINAGAVAGGDSRPIVFVNKGVIATDDVARWFADMLQKVNDGRVGNRIQYVEAAEAGIDI